MAKKSFEMSFEIGGKLASSFSNVFSNAKKSLGELKQESRQTQRALDQLGQEFRKGKIHQSQYADATDRLTRELEQLERAQDRISAMQTTLGNGLTTARAVAGMAAVGSAAVATGLALSSMDNAGDFEKQMAKAGVIASATSEQLNQLKATALELGATTSLSASEVSVAMTELAAKGMDTNKIIGAMPGIIAAAESSGEDLALTADVMSSALNTFGMDASKASKVADVLAKQANMSAASILDMQYALKYAGSPAKSLGVQFEELSASVGLVVDAGATGEQAGTTLRGALLSLLDPSEENSKMMKKMGIAITDNKGNFVGISKLIKNLSTSMKGQTETQKAATLASLVGKEAVSGMLTLMQAGPEKIDAFTKALENSEGSAIKAAAAMKDNYAGALDQLKGSVESAQIKFATPILPVFQDLFEGISTSIDKNMGGIEKAGERVAAGLKDIFEPFSNKKPEFDIRMMKDPDALQQYQKQLTKFNKFGQMDFGDKVVYMLDESAEKIEKWLSGSGGDSMNKIFTKLGEIAAKAWYEAFTATVKSAGSNLMQGNVFASLGLGAAAWMMGGGLLVKGGMGAGRWGMDKAKGAMTARTSKAPPVTTSSKSTPIPTQSNKVPATVTTAPSLKGGKVVQFPGPKGAVVPPTNKAFDLLGKSTKVLSKVALPLTVAAEGYNIYKSQDKTKSTVQAGSGLAGGWAGAKIGAAIGTAIAPGIGSAIGGVVGGIAGFVGGKWLGGKAVDQTRATAQPMPQSTSATSTIPSQTATGLNTQAIDSSTKVLMSEIQLASKNFSLLTMYTGRASGQIAGPTLELSNNIKLTTHNFSVLTTYSGQASAWIVGAFTGIKSSADTVKGNLDLLTIYTGQASGWLASLNGIQSAGQRVISALNNLERRINSVQLPSVKSKRVSY